MDFKCLKDCINMSSLFKSTNLLQIKDIYELEIARFMYLYFHHKLPQSFDK